MKSKFQYVPNIAEVWKTLQSVNEDMHNEVDNPLPAEIQQVITQLYTRDRQLEDYLTNLPTGGAGSPGTRWSFYIATLPGAQNYTLGPAGWPGKAEQYTIPFTPFSLAGQSTPAPSPGDTCITFLQTTIAYSMAASTDAVQLYAATDFGGLIQSALPWAQNSNGQLGVVHSSTSFYAAPTAVNLSLVTVQPNAAAALGAGAITIIAPTLVVVQFS